jgi:hypothetical protein
MAKEPNRPRPLRYCLRKGKGGPERQRCPDTKFLLLGFLKNAGQGDSAGMALYDEPPAIARPRDQSVGGASGRKATLAKGRPKRFHATGHQPPGLRTKPILL